MQQERQPPIVANNNNTLKPEYREGSIYQRDSALDVYRRVNFPTKGLDKHQNAEFRQVLNDLFAKHRPSQHSLWRTLANSPREVATNPGILREFYTRYQSAMHATRVSIYFMPYMDTPTQRQAKIKIILDDDTIDDTISHHLQLQQLFEQLGAAEVPDQERFGDLESLLRSVVTDPGTAAFCEMADRNYRAGLGGWTIFEVLSDDWISAMAAGFEPHYDREWLYKRQYFDEIATGHIEIEHMLQSLALTESLMHRRPDLIQEQICLAREMVAGIDSLWDSLERLITDPGQIARYSTPAQDTPVEPTNTNPHLRSAL